MAETELLYRLQRQFGEYLPDAERTSNIRTRIAGHLQNFVGDEQNQIPQHIQGLRRQFLRAAQINRKARQRLLALQEHKTSLIHPGGRDPVLDNHLEVLNLRSQYQDYQVLSHYVSRLEAISERRRALDTRPNHETNTSDHLETTDSSFGSELEGLVNTLETALLKANYQLERERKFLQQAKEKSAKPRGSYACELYALQATRSELTGWIEESLSKCDHSEPTDNPQKVDSDLIDETVTENGINEKYVQYCDARTRLLSTLNSSSHPLEIENQPLDQQKAVQQSPELVLSTIEAQYLPLWMASNVLRQQLQFVSESIEADDQQLMEKLHRLQDESHLLPAYPILSKAHQKSRSAQPDHARMLEAWRFANDAAQITTSEAIIRQSAEGHEANEKATKILSSLKLQSNLWQQVD